MQQEKSSQQSRDASLADSALLAQIQTQLKTSQEELKRIIAERQKEQDQAKADSAKLLQAIKDLEVCVPLSSF